MASRVELQAKLEKLLGSRNVYYQPPENLRMEYPCIRYSRNEIDAKHADNMKYSSFNSYEIIVISKRPDDEVIQKILELPYSAWERHYIADNLHHDILNLYY